MIKIGPHSVPGGGGCSGLRSPEPEDVIADAQLRADPRAAQRMMRRRYDFLGDDSFITFRGQDARDGLLEDLERELRET